MEVITLYCIWSLLGFTKAMIREEQYCLKYKNDYANTTRYIAPNLDEREFFRYVPDNEECCEKWKYRINVNQCGHITTNYLHNSLTIYTGSYYRLQWIIIDNTLRIKDIQKTYLVKMYKYKLIPYGHDSQKITVHKCQAFEDPLVYTVTVITDEEVSFTLNKKDYKTDKNITYIQTLVDQFKPQLDILNGTATQIMAQSLNWTKALVESNKDMITAEVTCPYVVQVYTLISYRASTTLTYLEFKFTGVLGSHMVEYKDIEEKINRGSVLKFQISTELGDIKSVTVTNKHDDEWGLDKISIKRKELMIPFIYWNLRNRDKIVNAIKQHKECDGEWLLNKDEPVELLKGNEYSEISLGSRPLLVFGCARLNYSSAKKHCNKYNATLATFNSIDIMNLLKDLFMAESPTYWLKSAQQNQGECMNLENCNLQSTTCSNQYAFICERDVAEWGKWENVTICSCGKTSYTQERQCLAGDCNGNSTRNVTCQYTACPEEWGEWKNVTNCTCGKTFYTQERQCLTGDCNGNSTRNVTCQYTACPEEWGEWKNVTNCTCGKTFYTQERQCLTGDCNGNSTRNVTCQYTACPEEWGEWKNVTNCTCGKTFYTQERQCLTGDCNGNSTRNVTCQYTACPEEWGEWKNVTNCTCGKTLYTQERQCLNGNCNGDSIRNVTCQYIACPSWSDWSYYEIKQELNCGTNILVEIRNRTCLNTKNVLEVETYCKGKRTENIYNNLTDCTGQGRWTEWTIWTSCQLTCGINITRIRTRKCEVEQQYYDQHYKCGNGRNFEETPCDVSVCPGTWSDWSTCQPTSFCSEGLQSRQCIGENDCIGNDNRNCELPDVCDSVKLAASGQSCTKFCSNTGQTCDPNIIISKEVYNQQASCNRYMTATNENLKIAPYYNRFTNTCILLNSVNEMDCLATPNNDEQRFCKCKQQGEWSMWSTCSLSCDGTKVRKRLCNFDIDEYCREESEVKLCSSPCPIHGGLTDWSFWTTCSASCGMGRKQRSRSCTNPSPSNGGQFCLGSLLEYEICGSGKCPVHGGWTQWSEWSDACSKPCNTGSFYRHRTCSDPKQLYGGKVCIGNATETRSCNENVCGDVRIRFTASLDDEFKGDTFYERYIVSYRFRKALEDIELKESVKKIKTFKLQNGSVIADVEFIFYHLDSYQLLMLMDAIEIDKAIGKEVLTEASNSNVTSNDVLIPSENVQITSNQTSFHVTWSHSNATQVSGYLVFYRQNINALHYESIATKNPDAMITGLELNRIYICRIVAYNNKGNGIPTKAYTISTMSPTFIEVPNEPPINLNAKAFSESSLLVTWDKNNNDQPIDGYTVSYSIVGQNSTERKEVSNQMIMLNNLQSHTSYFIQVCAFNVKGTGPCEQTVGITKYKPIPSEPPHDLKEVYRSNDRIQVSWSPPDFLTNDLVGYKLKIVMLHNFKSYERTSKLLPLALTEYHFVGLEANSNYTVTACSVNDKGKLSATSIVVSTCKCEKTAYSNFYYQPPYVDKNVSEFEETAVGIFPDILRNSIREICGVCQVTSNSTYTTEVELVVNGKGGFSAKTQMSQVLDDIDTFTHLHFPLTTNYGTNTRFVALIQYPGAAYVIRKTSVLEHVMVIVNRSLDTWPILFVYVLLTLTAGMLLWVLDLYTSNRPHEFSTSFLHGLGQTFYFIFITQTTVGYGDYTVKSKRERSIVIIWILICLVMTSFLVGSLTSAFTAVAVKETTLYGKKIGTINGFFETNLAIMKNGKVDNSTKYDSVQKLLAGLTNNEVDGILLDVYTASTFRKEIDKAEGLTVKLINYPRYYGVVLSGSFVNIADELKDEVFVKQKEILHDVEKQTSNLMHNEDTGEATSIFDSDSPTFVWCIEALGCMLTAAILGGLMLWWYRTKRKQVVKVEPIENTVDTALPYKALTREVIKFRYKFYHTAYGLQVRMVNERIKLWTDHGESSLSRHPEHHVYIRPPQPPSLEPKETVFKVFRKLSKSLSNNSSQHDGEVAGPSKQRRSSIQSILRKVSRPAESSTGYSTFHNFEEEDEYNNASPDHTDRSYNEIRVKALEGDLEELERGGPIESDIEDSYGEEGNHSNELTDYDTSDSL